METLSITSKKPFSMVIIEGALSKDLVLEISDNGVLAVHGATSRAYISLESESENFDLQRLMIDYSDVELAKSILEKIADDPGVTVDNDFGTVLPGDEFVARCKTEKGWDWRSVGG